MSNGSSTTLIVRYMDGTEQLYTISGQEADHFSTGNRVEELMKESHLALLVGGKLVISPLQNIRTIEISPPPASLPPNVIRNVEYAP